MTTLIAVQKLNNPTFRALHLIRFVCAMLVMALIQGCDDGRNSGIYVRADPRYLAMIQIVETPDHKVSGRYEFREIAADGQISRDVELVEGSAHGSELMLLFRPSWAPGGTSGTANVDGDELTVTTASSDMMFKRSSLERYRTALKSFLATAHEAETKATPDTSVNPIVPAQAMPMSKPSSDNRSRMSFTCPNAVRTGQRIICEDEALTAMDRLTADLLNRIHLRAAPRIVKRVEAEQVGWSDQRNECSNIVCLRELYSNRLNDLATELAAINQALRRNIQRTGECELTIVDRVSHRFIDDPNSGSEIGFANGVDLVGYDELRDVTKSKIGDRARVCLVSVPQNCPPGDNRGSIYEVTNLNNQSKWRLADSPHSCGGA